MARTYQVISGDGHVETPPDGWLEYVPDEYRDRAPRLIRLPDGSDGWLVEGQPMLHNGQNIKGRGPGQVRQRQLLQRGRLGRARAPATPCQRLHEQDIDGIDAEVLFAPVFVARFIESIADKRRLPVDRAGLQHLAGRGLLLGGARPADRQRPHPDLGHRRRRRRARPGQGSSGLRSIQLQQYPNGSGAPEARGRPVLGDGPRAGSGALAAPQLRRRGLAG